MLLMFDKTQILQITIDGKPDYKRMASQYALYGFLSFCKRFDKLRDDLDRSGTLANH